MADARTLAVYREKAADYAETFKGAGEDPHLETFIMALPQGAYVLDLGCGPGIAARRMIEAGLGVDAMDASPEMVEMANASGVAATCSTFSELDAHGAYDGVWANFSLLHAPKSEFPGHLTRVRKAMRPGGLFHIAMKTGKGEHRDTLGRFYAFYEPEELERLLGNAGFSVEGTAFGADRGLAGTRDPWIAVRARA